MASSMVPIDLVGSSTFGIHRKISTAKTLNLFISDDWLTSYTGYRALDEISTDGIGRGIFHSSRGEFAIVVMSYTVYRVNQDFSVSPLFNLETAAGEVSIDENLARQICIVDGSNAYIYNYQTESSGKVTLFVNDVEGSDYAVTPNYVTFHNSFFLFGSASNSPNPQYWYAFRNKDQADGLGLEFATELLVSTKPDQAKAVVRLPGKGNNVLALGNYVAEVWTQVGGVDNYRRVSSFNIDYGCVSINTIASSDRFVVFLGSNIHSKPSIIICDGGQSKAVSTDGLDKLLATVNRPDLSTAYIYQEQGHLFYHITFFHDSDNFSLFYDLKEDKFYHAADECMNYYPIRQVMYYKNRILGVSLNDGKLYDLSLDYPVYNYNVDTAEDDTTGSLIPRIRICSPIRKKDNSTFRVQRVELTVNQVDKFHELPSQLQFRFSKNGGYSYSNVVERPYNDPGYRRNKMKFLRLGFANEFIPHFRFVSYDNVVAKDAYMEIF
jgi:hypothetical protein